MNEDLLKKAITQKHLTRDTVVAQFCSDGLKDEIIKLFDEIRALREELKIAQENAVSPMWAGV